MDADALGTIAWLTGREQLLIAAGRGAPMHESPDKLAALGW